MRRMRSFTGTKIETICYEDPPDPPDPFQILNPLSIMPKRARTESVRATEVYDVE